MSERQPRIGFLGLGRMGMPMAGRVLAAGHELVVWNRSRDRCTSLEAMGAAVAETPRALAADADIMITVVADAAALGAIMDGDNGLVAGLGDGKIVVDMSTIGPDAARAFASRVAATGAEWVDSPVSGSVALAEQGTLTLMIGGSEAAVARAQPVLDTMSRASVHLGPAGAGAAMKLAVNSVIAVLNEAIAEALVLAERSGIPRDLAYDVFATGAVAAPYVQYKRDAFLHPDEAPVGFTVDLLEKDLGLILSLADSLGLALPAVSASADVIERAQRSGLGQADLSRVADVIRG
jgi:3-hydroxyisobutyrate dehydrogenase/2-hydroxy-3-oxopropionate reductase